jgi:prepilin peptidase CpaA
LMVLVLAVTIVCGVTDGLYQKIWNVVTFPAIGLGLLLNLAFVLVDRQLGVDFFLSSLGALAVGFAIMFVLFLFGGMGGGDVKLVAAIAAADPYHFGIWFGWWLVLYSVLAGGVISIIVMALHGRLIRSFRNVFRTAFTFVMPGMAHEPLKREDSMTIPFGLGIGFGTLWTLLLIQIGVLPG